MKKMTVKTKLSLAFGGLALMVLVVSVFAIRTLGEASERFHGYVDGINARALMAASVRTAVDLRAIAARNLVLVSSPQDIEREKALVFKAQEEVVTRLAELVRMGQEADVPEQVRQMIAEIAKVEQAYEPVALGIVDLALKGQREEASRKIVEECRPLLDALGKAADTYATVTAERSQAMVDDAQARYALQRDLLLGACALVFFGAIAAGVLITRGLLRELGAEPAELGQAARRVAAGDLSPVPGAARAAKGSVLESLGEMQASLVQVVARVRESAESLSVASAEIAQGNADLSSRTESQASALEETAASMEELGSTVNHNADNARQANQLAQSASSVAVQGGQVVAQVVGTMKDINDSSRKIADIIGVIDGIAFQTNILALNAAVEAARAGEQGRGFAVVASEVRSLAGRSAEAAKEIKALIGASVDRVEQGSALVDQAGSTMEEVVTSIRRVADIMGEISSASVEQSTGVAQVGEAVNQMDHATQQNAAMVEEMSASAANLRSQAQDMVQAVSVFKLDRIEGGRPAYAATLPKASAPAAGHNRQLPKSAMPKKLPAPKAEPTQIAPSLNNARPKTEIEGDWESF